MKKLLIPVASILLLAFALVACGKPIGGAKPTQPAGCTGGKIEMASSTFVQETCSISAGSQVTFVDPTGTGNYHVLCLGKDQACVADPNGPTELNASGGVTFNAGDAPKSYTFATAGTYEVTCTVHPDMNVTITVH